MQLVESARDFHFIMLYSSMKYLDVNVADIQPELEKIQDPLETII
ncbi:hypothetical protein Mpsy_1249 [Methanolobus psychrophilus R15]|nr:hypothetical protein Mpsy_1249 [Methanolobus psychrophilus R15]